MAQATVYLTRKVGSTDWKQGEIVKHTEAGVHMKHGGGLDADVITFYPAHMVERIEYRR